MHAKLEVLTKLASRCGSYSVKLVRRDGELCVAEYRNGRKWNEETVPSVQEGLELVETIRQEEKSDGVHLIRCQGYTY